MTKRKPKFKVGQRRFIVEWIGFAQGEGHMTKPLWVLWREERAHTYASENADHYRGFDAGRQRSADQLEAAAKRVRERVMGLECIRRWANPLIERDAVLAILADAGLLREGGGREG